MDNYYTKGDIVILLSCSGSSPNILDALEYCKKRKIFIIEDAAESLGQKIYNKNCGSFGDISTFSFYANKQITTGEGGMITTNNKKIYNKMKRMREL